MAHSNQPSDINTMLEQLMQKVVNNQTLQSQLFNNNNNNNNDLPCSMNLHIPDVYNGENTLTAVKNWIDMLNNRLDLLTLGNNQKVKFVFNLLRETAIHW